MDKTEELQKYKALLDAGAITQEEFTQLKQRLLGLESPPAAADEKQAARAAALAEIEQMHQKQARRQAARQETAGKVWRFAKLLLKWVLTVFLALFGFACLLVVGTGIRYLFVGILALLLAAMACPPLTAKTRDIEALAVYYRFKVLIAAALAVVMLLVMAYAP